MFYYVIHFYVIHIAAVIAGLLSGFTWNDIFNTMSGKPLQDYGFKLWVVYFVWVGIVIFMYPLCKWYAKYKYDHPEKWWLSYL